MKACQEDGVVRGAQEARRNGAVAHLRAQSGQRRGWGGGEFGCGRTQRRCAGVVVDAGGVACGESGDEVDGVEHDMSGAVTEGVLESIHDLPAVID